MDGSDAVTYGNGGGGPNNPFATLSHAITQANLNSISHIKVANGNYTESSIITIPANLVIEGRYAVVGSEWVKQSTTAGNTLFTCSGEQSISGVRHRIGFRSSAAGWKLIDINVTTTAITNLYDGSNRGASNYALHLSNASAYEITRCRFQSGNASNGNNAPTNTNPGGGGGGGSGGGGSNGYSSGCNTSNSVAAGTGGTGAAGGAAAINTSNAGGAGNRGTGGAGYGTNDSGCNPVGTVCQTTGNNGGTGGNGGVGGSWQATNRPDAAVPTNVIYYVPAAQAAPGGNGGGGGGGGGGSGSRGGTVACFNCDGKNGRTGSNGGAGGGGGAGAYAGGGSFGIWRFNSGATAIATNQIVVGSAGTGGNGAAGRPGVAGGGFVTGDNSGSCVGGNPRGGGGGAGGTGGAGGRGRDGANGVAHQLVTNGTPTSPSVTVPNGTTVTVTYNNNMKLCRNSVITVTKSGGNWTLPGNFDFVRHNQAATASQYGVGSATADIFPNSSATAGYTNLTANSVVFNNYLKVESDARPLPVVTVRDIDGTTLPVTSPVNMICVSGSVNLISSTAFGTKVDYRWEVFSGTSAPNKSAFPNASAVFSSNVANPTFGPFNTAGTYTVRYQERDRCCGWSIPAFATITVRAQPTAPTGATLTPNAAEACLGATLQLATPTGVTNGVTAYTYEYDISTPSAGYDDYSSTNSIVTSVIGNHAIKVRVQARPNLGCEASPDYENTWLVVPDPSAGTVIIVTPVVDSLCEGGTIVVESQGNSGGTGTITDHIRYRINGGTPVTYSGPISNAAAGLYEFSTRRTATGSHCEIPDPAWSSWVSLYRVIADPTINTQPSSPTTICVGGTSAPMTVVASGGFPTNGLTYQWEYNSGTWNPVDNGTPAGSVYSGNTTNSLTVAGITAVAGHQYRCIITSPGEGCATLTSNIVTVTVVADPSITTQPTSPNAICTGGSIPNRSLVATGGSPSLTYQWEYYNGSTWNDVAPNVPTGASYSGATTNNAFSVSGITATGNHLYQCVVSASGDGCGDATSNTITVSVIAQPVAPTMTKVPNVGTVCEGATLEVTPAGGTLGAGTCENEYRYSTNGGGSWTTWSTTVPSFSAVTGVNIVESRRNCDGDNCTSNENQVSWDVEEDPEAPTIVKETSVNFATVCVGATLTVTTSGGTGGTGTCNNEYRFNNGSGWSAWSTSVPSFSAALGTNYIESRRYCDGSGCNSNENQVSWTVIADPVAPTMTKSPNVTNVCAGASLTITPSAGSGGEGTCNDEYRYSTNNGGSWTSWSTSVPSFSAVEGTNLIESRRNCSGSGCNSN
jgi:hypothetical protein